MAKSTLSLLGIYNYDDSVLDDLALPPELEDSRETIVNNLLLESAELEILFPEPNTLKSAIKFWSRKCLPVWQELYDTTQYEYNPIWNKDGTFSELETRDLSGTNNNTETRNLAGSRSSTESRNNTETRNLAGSESESGSGSDDTSNYVYGYNSETRARESDSETDSSYSRSNQSTQTGTVGNQGSSTIQDSSTDTGTVTEQGNTSDTGTILRERTEQGNIGLTSTQELIERQRAVVEFNIMDRIIKDFIARFCILVY